MFSIQDPFSQLKLRHCQTLSLIIPPISHVMAQMVWPGRISLSMYTDVRPKIQSILKLRRSQSSPRRAPLHSPSSTWNTKILVSHFPKIWDPNVHWYVTKSIAANNYYNSPESLTQKENTCLLWRLFYKVNVGDCLVWYVAAGMNLLTWETTFISSVFCQNTVLLFNRSAHSAAQSGNWVCH